MLRRIFGIATILIVLATSLAVRSNYWSVFTRSCVTPVFRNINELTLFGVGVDPIGIVWGPGLLQSLLTATLIGSGLLRRASKGASQLGDFIAALERFFRK